MINSCLALHRVSVQESVFQTLIPKETWVVFLSRAWPNIEIKTTWTCKSQKLTEKKMFAIPFQN